MVSQYLGDHMFTNKAPAAQPLLNICPQTRTQFPNYGVNICSASRSPPGGREKFGKSLGFPIFEIEILNYMNYLTIPINQTALNCQIIRNYQLLGAAASFQNCLTIQKIKNIFNCQTI